LDDHTIPPTQLGLTRPYRSRKSTPPQAVLFDLDDTLADRSAAIKVYASAFATDHADVLLPCTVDGVHQALILADDFGSLRQAQRLCAAALWREPVTPERLFDHWAAEFGKATTPVEGMRLVIDELLQRGVKLGIITNGGAAMQRAKIDTLGIGPAMSRIVISQDVGLSKPDPAIFRHALRVIDCSPERAWFVGDNPEVDIDGARRAGLRGFWLETPNHSPPPPPTEHLGALKDLLRFL
jgi:putative hydrolase of the HAD superfamily